MNNYFKVVVASVFYIITIHVTSVISAPGNSLALDVYLITAVDAQNIKEVHKALQMGANVNALVDGIRPLHLAIAHANQPIVEFLLLRGASLNQVIVFKDKEYTALDLAKFNIEECHRIIDSYKQQLDILNAQYSSSDKSKLEKFFHLEERLEHYKSLLNSFQELSTYLQNYQSFKIEN